MRDLEMRLNRFAHEFPGPMSAVKANQVREYLGNQKRKNGKPVATRRRRNFQTVVNSLFHFARTRHYIVRDVVDEICEIESRKVLTAETGLFAPEQMKHHRREAGDGGRWREIAAVVFASARTAWRNSSGSA
jgi:hypothetical protein